jgi:hypothetical protein
MTEAEWQACTDPQPMLEFLRGKVSDRKLRLFACACCRRNWGGLGWNSRKAVAIAERYADGQAGWWKSYWGEMLAVFNSGGEDEQAVYVTVCPWGGWADADPDGVTAASLVARLSRGEGRGLPSPTASAGPAGRPSHQTDSADCEAERQAQCELLRDLFGSPFRPVSLDPVWLAWNDGAVRKLAQTIYDERRFGDLPILADALEDAGCADDGLLGHLRGKGPHVRGCWALDLLLGKA